MTRLQNALTAAAMGLVVIVCLQQLAERRAELALLGLAGAVCFGVGTWRAQRPGGRA